MVNVWIGSFYSLRVVLFLWILKHVLVECEQNVTDSSPPGAGDEHQEDEEVIKETVSEKNNNIFLIEKRIVQSSHGYFT